MALHSLDADTTGELLVNGNGRKCYCPPKRHVIFPDLKRLRFATIRQHLIDISHCADGETDKTVRDFEG